MQIIMKNEGRNSNIEINQIVIVLCLVIFLFCLPYAWMRICLRLQVGGRFSCIYFWSC